MPTETSTDPRKNFVPRFLPWLLAAFMFSVFLVTLNPWVTLMNLDAVSTISGWKWTPQFLSPLTFLVTVPFRLLSAEKIPFALNVFSALCGALALGLLARCVILLPHDRTELQRQRERSDFTFLTGWIAWLPPVLAVLLAGLQLTFWEHATSFTGETFDLLLFAIIVWQLLEYRLDEAPWRLFLAAILYGAGITEDWAFVAFFPVFILAIIWLRGREFFNLGFLTQMFFCGLAGLLFFFLLPVHAKISADFKLTFWNALSPNLKADWQVIRAVAQTPVQHALGLMALTTLLPVFLFSIRWSANFGDSSHLGKQLVNYLFHLVSAVIFVACIWVMFDPKFSPRQLGMGSPSLTLYFFAALSVGYYCGYFLLVFGKAQKPSRRGSVEEPVFPKSLNWLCPVIVTAVFLFAAFAVALLAYKNISIVRRFNNDIFLKYAQSVTSSLPAGGAILLSDSESPTQDQPTRAYLIHAMLVREGRAKDFPVVDTQSLNWPPYHRFLHAHFPKKWPLIVGAKDEKPISPLILFHLLDQLSKTNTLVYLNPSFGYYFEEFYQEPHGLVYFLKPLPENTLLPPPLNKNLISENESFWSNVEQKNYPAMEKSFAAADPAKPKNFLDQLLQKVHVIPEENVNALLAGAFYSRAENFWGVELQRDNQLDAAAAHFSAAEKVNPNNVNASINLAFNGTLRAGHASEVDLSRVTSDQFGKYHNWNEVISANGPFDETSFCFENGIMLVRSGLLRQATASFARVEQLAPDNLAARLWLAQIYLFARQPDRAMSALRDPLTQPARFSLNETNSTELNVLASAVYFQKNDVPRGVELLQTEIARHPDDDVLLTAATQAFFMRGLYTNALQVIQRKLAQDPNSPQWLFGKGYANIQIHNYPAAIAAMTRVLEIKTNDPTARFNRALAYLESTNLPAARADYSQLQSAYTNSFQVAFGLAEIAWRDHDTNEAIRNYEIYLANAPTNSAEAKNVRERLNSLKR